MTTFLGRYTSIIITTVIFLALVLSVLGLNFYSSFETEASAERVNIAGRQRMLSQRVAKSLSNLNYAYIAQADISSSMGELKQSANLFNRTLTAFISGGMTASTKSGEALLSGASNPSQLEILNQANLIWSVFFNDISSMLSKLESMKANASDHATIVSSLDQNIDYANKNINTLLSLMNDLTNYEQEVASQAANQSRLIQVAGIVMSLVCFSIILMLIFGQLGRADRKALAARNETKKILETVDQGLFLLDKDLNMGSQQSKELEHIFSQTSLSGKNFKDLIGELVSESDLQKVQRYIKLLFDPHKKQRLLKDLNPLNKLPVQIQNGNQLTNKFLKFSFSRVVDGKEINGILTSINDISNEVKLENELLEETRRGEQQLEMISALLSADANLLPEFVASCEQTYAQINETLRGPSRDSAEFKAKADSMMTLIHSVKGESAALGLGPIYETCNDIETRIDELKKLPIIGGEDFLSLTIMLDRLISTNDQMKSVLSVVANSVNAVDNNSQKVVQSDDSSNLFQLCDDVAVRQGKQVEMAISGFNSIELPRNTRKDILSLSSQLIRNSISHGIELPEHRKTSGKSVAGKVNIALFTNSNGSLTLSCEDDGRGIDFDALSQQAVKQGLINKDDASSGANERLVSLMFRNRLSSNDTPDIDSGRGVGLSVIGTITNRLNAKISLRTKRGDGTKFLITIPIQQAENPVAERLYA